MKQKTALIIAAGATAFMLVTAGAVVRTTTQAAAAQSTAGATPAPTLAVPATDPNASQYQQLVNEANNRIQQLKDENAKLRTELEQSKAGNPASSASSPVAGQISADAAAQAALNLAPGAQLMSTPELVDFQGTTAYEVVLDAGTVYVDAGSGQPIYAIPTRQRNHRHSEEDEHEEHERFEEHEEGSDS